MFPMDSSSISMIVAIVVLVTMSAYFSATETAFSCMNKIRMKSRAEPATARPCWPWSWRRTMTG